MAEKEHTLVITLNSSCCRCFTKIRKTLCKLQETENIRAISYDEKSGTVTISGPFDPLMLPCKLRCKASCVIKDIQIKEKKPPPPSPPIKRRTPPPSPPPTPPKQVCPPPPACSCHGGVCHCGGHGYHYGWCCCSACAAPPPCYGPPYGDCSKVKIVICDSDMPQPCSIM
ncbi:hypothetical protein ACP70R_032840 [Stipagrostis hirtigluma subsp. patula]